MLWVVAGKFFGFERKTNTKGYLVIEEVRERRKQVKEKIDFIIKEENGERLIFRFFPKKSEVEFAEGYNKDWSNIWNITYDWKIIKQIKRNKRYISKTIYHHPYDTSCLEDLPDAINEIIGNKENVYLECERIAKMEETDWILTYNKESSNIDFKIYEHHLFDDGGEKYFLFSLPIDKAKDFASYIDTTVNYLIENSELNYFGQ